jgi:LacI family transcriptional regulator
LISASHSHRNEAEILLRFMSQGMVDGLMLMVPVLGRLRLAGLEELSLPIALLNLPPENKIQCLHINVDNYRGAYLMTKHLLDHGYRPLAMIRGPAGNFDADERERGFRAALTEYHLPQDAIHFERGDFMRRSGYFAMSRLLSLPQRPRAVFAANDDMAVGALEAARQLGVNVPGEVALAGFDDIAAAGYLRPALTTVHMPIAELGTMATQKLIEAIQSEAARENASQKFILPTGLVIRESCGCSFQNVMAEKRERR